jgi:hypothetical protein
MMMKDATGQAYLIKFDGANYPTCNPSGGYFDEDPTPPVTTS